MMDKEIDLKESLMRCEDRYRLLSETMQEVVWVLDAESRMFTYVSPSVQKLRGYTPEEIMALPMDDALTEESRQLVRSSLKMRLKEFQSEAHQSDKVSVSEVEQPCKDGSTVWTEVSTSLRQNIKTGRIEVVGITRDISARHKAEASLQEKSAELSRYFSMALDLFCIADTDGHFLQLNAQWETTLGYKIEELEGKRFLDFIHPDDLESTLQALSQLNDQFEILNFVNRYRCKDGSYRWIEWRSSPYGKKIYAAARDITARKNLEEELRQKSAMLERQMNEIDKQLRLAATVQKAILQGDYKDDAVIIRTIYHPVHIVSGDSYLYRYWPEKKILNGFLFDVSGHGEAAALQTAGIRVLIEQELKYGENWFSDTLAKLNERVGPYLYENAFVAAIMFSLNLQTGMMTCVSGGINHFLILKGKESKWVSLHGSYLGISSNADFGAVQIPAESGTAFFFITDGISDQLDLSAKNQFVGFDEGIKSLEAIATQSTRRDDCSALCIQIR